ncbi:MAG: right-handed parallel beta-helix repeat-containing protein [Desulfobacteraceae bacterium]|nr:right-handed parallel beta-helix repeat-containing protein [Desulfobacteraceae bacterium]
MKHSIAISIILGIILGVVIFSANMVYALSGDVYGVWPFGSTMVIDGDVQVPAGETLVIEPGTDILFTGRYSFTVFGRLQAVGTADHMIVFTRAYDTEASKWSGIRFDNADDASILEFCKVEYVHKDGAWPFVRGGGIWIDNCSPTIRYCTLTQNYSRNENRNGSGGGVCLNSNSNSIIEYNTIEFNEADSGGGILVGNDCNAVVRNNQILNNRCFSSGAGIYVSAWGNAEISNNLIKDNYSYGWAGGGGITLWNAYCREDGCTRVFNNMIINNTALTWGGGIYSRYNESLIYNNTIAGNSADSGGGIHVLNQGNMVPVIFNCIVWANTATQGPGIHFYFSETTQASITYCDIEGGFSGIGNIDANPLFADISNNNYQLGLGSPCIDAGDNDSEVLPYTDYYGDARMFDDPATADTGSGQAPIVDMGADEYHVDPCPADLDGDQDVDEDDLVILTGDFGRSDCFGSCPADYDADNDVDGQDLSFFSLYYGQCQ